MFSVLNMEIRIYVYFIYSFDKIVVDFVVNNWIFFVCRMGCDELFDLGSRGDEVVYDWFLLVFVGG